MKDQAKREIDAERRAFLKQAGAIPAAFCLAGCATGASGSAPVQRAGAPGAMTGFAAEPLDTVRVAVIGTGRRGLTLLRLLAAIDGVEIRAICDPYAPAIARATALLSDAGAATPAVYGDGDYAYRSMLDRNDVDAVFVVTPWRWHTPMAVDTMRAGKHAFVEVPAALTLDECWQLVETAEATRRHCMMLENVCYGREEMMALNMVRDGVLGELLHGESAYIQVLRWQMKDIEEGSGCWRTDWHTKRDANLYPTHGLGPIAQYMDINRGDRFDYLTSMSSPARGRQLYAAREFPPDHLRNRAKYVCGDMNTSIIKTALGRTIVVQHDTTTPRPYTRHNLIQGTNGVYARYPDRIAVESEGDFHEWQHDMASWRERYEHPLWRRLASAASENEGHGGMDYVMLWDIVDRLRSGRALDQTVYDAAAWSAVIPLSEASNADRGNSRDFPDFTRGAWSSAPPLTVAA